MKLILYFILAIPYCHCYGQIFTKVSEEIIPIGNGSTYLGKCEFAPLYYSTDDRFIPRFEFFRLNEDLKNTSKVTSIKFLSPFEKSDWSSGFLRLQNAFDNKWFYTVGYMNDDYTIYHQSLWLQYMGKNYHLDSIYNADKKIHSSFSSDGRYLLVNTLNTLYDYYNPEQDNRIMVYDLENIDEGVIQKEYIPCNQCSDSYLIGDRLFFTVGRKDGYDNFSNKDIYVVPWASLKDSVKVASNTTIKAISPDGKYILGTRFWDRQKLTDVILDVDQKKYQMILGRNYAERKAFYSNHKDKFTYDFKGYLIYIEFPKNFPFDVLKWKNEEIPDWTDEVFWGQYEHPSLPGN